MKMTIRLTLTQDEYNSILKEAIEEDVHSMSEVMEMLQDQLGEAIWNVGYEADIDIDVEVI